MSMWQGPQKAKSRYTLGPDSTACYLLTIWYLSFPPLLLFQKWVLSSFPLTIYAFFWFPILITGNRSTIKTRSATKTRFTTIPLQEYYVLLTTEPSSHQLLSLFVPGLRNSYQCSDPAAAPASWKSSSPLKFSHLLRLLGSVSFLLSLSELLRVQHHLKHFLKKIIFMVWGI